MESSTHGVHPLLDAVVVDFNAGEVLAGCVASLVDEGLERIIVVENGVPGSVRRALGETEVLSGPVVEVVVPGRNVGYGAGANRGMAAAQGGVEAQADAEYVLVCNPDLLVHPGAVAALTRALDEEPAWAIVGPRILDAAGVIYPSVRRFPSMTDAVGHALLALWKPDNRFSRRYRPFDGGGEVRRSADWVSGACLLLRRSAMEELGGFDEAYFMFAEDMDLCWRAHRAGWGVGVEPAAVVTHAEGVSRSRHPYRMLVAHHRSALRFASKTTVGWRRIAIPVGAVVLAFRFVVACGVTALRR